MLKLRFSKSNKEKPEKQTIDYKCSFIIRQTAYNQKPMKFISHIHRDTTIFTHFTGCHIYIRIRCSYQLNHQINRSNQIKIKITLFIPEGKFRKSC